MRSLSYLLMTYLFASIPFGLLFGKLLNKEDLRQTGSGNIGATNALRVGGKLQGALTLFADIFKGFIFVYFAPNNIHEWVAFVAILAHIFPIWLGFKGGKGVATALGALLPLYPYAGLCAVVAWLVTFKISKISSLSALVAFFVLPLFSFFIYQKYLLCLGIMIIIFFTHRQNIQRLVRGSEKIITKDKI